MNTIDETGNRYGRLKVVRRNGSASGHGGAAWLCSCECGGSITAKGSILRRGQYKSCGCLREEAWKTFGARMTKHGGVGTPEYTSWKKMKDRCLNPKNQYYRNYGGRGIGVCDRWLDFANFQRDMGQRPADMSIDRINNDKGYSPENCRWATRRQQNNNKSSNHRLEFDGMIKTVTEWARHIGIKPKTLFGRLAGGWSINKALTTAVACLSLMLSGCGVESLLAGTAGFIAGNSGGTEHTHEFIDHEHESVFVEHTHAIQDHEHEHSHDFVDHDHEADEHSHEHEHEIVVPEHFHELEDHVHGVVDHEHEVFDGDDIEPYAGKILVLHNDNWICVAQDSSHVRHDDEVGGPCESEAIDSLPGNVTDP